MRIRSIKPEFYRSDDISVLSWEERLLFIGLWSYVDDNGVGTDRLASIAADLFSGDIERDPSDTFARVSRGLQTLSDSGRITRYAVEGKQYLHITNWAKHQRIDKPNKPRYPLPTCENAEVVAENATPSRQSRETPATGTGEQRNRGTEEVKTPSSPATPSKEFATFWDAYPKKISKQAALKAWNKAAKTADPADIISGARRYAQAVQGSEKQFIKGPDGWLNAGRWEDETSTIDRPTTGAASVVPIGYAWANR